jgi:hypothetical protein
MNLKDFLSRKGKAPKVDGEDWLYFCTLDVTTGSLRAGDPHVAFAADGYVTQVPRGRYVVEGIGRAEGRYRFVARLRVRLQGVTNPVIGKELGKTGTDSAMIGVCDIKAFDKARASGLNDEVYDAIEAQIKKDFGIINLKKFPGAIMPFVPVGSDGSGPVLALVSGRKRVGIELPLMGEPAEDADSDQFKAVSLLGNDKDDFITRLMADGTEASFWIGGELKADKKFYIWSTAASGPIEYQVRRPGGRAVTKWSPLKKKSDQSFAIATFGPGNYEIYFRIGKSIYSAIKFAIS